MKLIRRQLNKSLAGGAELLAMGSLGVAQSDRNDQMDILAGLPRLFLVQYPGRSRAEV